MRRKHEEIIDNSVNIIKEINNIKEVNSSKDSERLTAPTLSLPAATARNPLANVERSSEIRKLIQGFEVGSSNLSLPRQSSVLENNLDIHEILSDFEEFKENKLLTESLFLFRKAKESFEKIDSFFGRLNAESNTLNFTDDKLKRTYLRNNFLLTNNTPTKYNYLELKSKTSGLLYRNNNTIQKMSKEPIVQDKCSSSSSSSFCSLQGGNVRDKIKLFTQTGSNICNENLTKRNDSNKMMQVYQQPLKKEVFKETDSKNITSLPQPLMDVNLDRLPSLASCSTNYMSCCGSLMSIGQYFSADDIPQRTPSQTLSIEKGYEGDCDDSEYDLTAKHRIRRR